MRVCPRCGAAGARIVRDRANAVRIVASLGLLPVYLLGGLAGDFRGPLLPLVRRCPRCGVRFRERSVVDDVLRRRRPRSGDADEILVV